MVDPRVSAGCAPDCVSFPSDCAGWRLAPVPLALIVGRRPPVLLLGDALLPVLALVGAGLEPALPSLVRGSRGCFPRRGGCVLAPGFVLRARGGATGTSPGS